jgi:hypothetical protein
MSRFSLSGLLSAGVLCASMLLAPSAGVSQSTPKTPVFHAQFGAAWMEVGDEFLPPPSGPGPVVNDPRYPYIDNGRARRESKQPTYRVADLSNPILQDWAKAQMKKANDEVLAGKVPFRPRERCYPGSVPGFVVYTLVTPFFFIQTDKQVTLVNEGGPEVRRVHMNVAHSANPKPSWYGESVGHYENGDTLVIDTIGITTKAFVDNYRTPHTDALHVVERYKILDQGKTLEVLITVEDQGAFTTPWSAVQRFRLVEGRPLTESPCAENNFDHFNFGVAPLPEDNSPDF